MSRRVATAAARLGEEVEAVRVTPRRWVFRAAGAELAAAWMDGQDLWHPDPTYSDRRRGPWATSYVFAVNAAREALHAALGIPRPAVTGPQWPEHPAVRRQLEVVRMYRTEEPPGGA